MKNIRANSKVGFSVDTGEELKEFRGVVGAGTARILTPTDRLYDEMLKKYIIHTVGSLDHPIAKEMMKTTDRVIIEITPTSMTSWNYSKTLPKIDRGDLT